MCDWFYWYVDLWVIGYVWVEVLIIWSWEGKLGCSVDGFYYLIGIYWVVFDMCGGVMEVWL